MVSICNLAAPRDCSDVSIFKVKLLYYLPQGGNVLLGVYLLFVSVSGVRTCPLADANPQNFMDPWTDGRSLVDENM